VRRVAVVSVGRSDYGHLAPVLDAAAAAGLEAPLVVSGAHLDPAFGATVGEVEADGRPIAARVESSAGDDSAVGVAHAIGRAVAGFADAFAQLRPDAVLVLGDRFEMQAAALAALPLNIPVAHLHGGESSEGAIDESLRHSITKLSHLHFAATEHYARRIVQLGEEPWRVTVTGAPGLDAIAALDPLGDDELAARTGLSLDEPTLLVTYHPETLAPGDVGRDVDQLAQALERVDLQLLITAPNADTHGLAVRARLGELTAGRRGAVLVESLGSRGYLSALRRVAAMVGNSSSGIIEAPSFELPVVNVGDRQRGRVRAANVLDVPPEREAIRAAVARAVAPEFRAGLAGLANPYGDGRASERIVRVLRDTPADRRLLVKSFHDRAAP
jgi:UDP-hydrolysing UDP-N-acetyl-D-glucosamine 2-epimerase